MSPFVVSQNQNSVLTSHILLQLTFFKVKAESLFNISLMQYWLELSQCLVNTCDMDVHQIAVIQNVIS